jgi:Ca2+-binding RTX toxin-like protein
VANQYYYNGTVDSSVANGVFYEYTAGTIATFGRAAQYSVSGLNQLLIRYKASGSLNVLGSLFSSASTLVEAVSGIGSLTATIGTTGSMLAAGASAISTAATNTYISNAGYIQGDTAIVTATGGVETTLLNTGTILGNATGAKLGAGETLLVNNTGTVAGSGSATNFGYGLYLTGNATTTVNNSGTIAGANYGVAFDQPAGKAHVLVNSGTISGGNFAILGLAGDEAITNVGVMLGQVSLGDGSDSFEGSAGRQSGPVNGGGGNDILIGSLGAGNQLLGGSGDDQLTGGDGRDVLTGGSGADEIDGGAGIDIASWRTEAVGAVVDLADNLLNAGSASGDTLTDIEGVQGSTNAADRLYGDDARNWLYGFGGNDLLDGRGGADVLRGGAGDDTYFVDTLADRVVEVAGEGSDVIISAITWRLSGNVENLYLLPGNTAIDGYGDAGANTLVGNAGINILDGGAGSDTLTGLGGRDAFFFSTAPAGGVDTITDFTSAFDTIRLSSQLFTGIAKGRLTSDAFWAGTGAHDASDRIIFNASTGQLYWDADGTGAGGQVLFAVLGGGAAVVANDIIVY